APGGRGARELGRPLPVASGTELGFLALMKAFVVIAGLATASLLCPASSYADDPPAEASDWRVPLGVGAAVDAGTMARVMQSPWIHELTILGIVTPVGTADLRSR
ncbi:MAG: hypothetical protein AAGA56_18380, partial [Myxococcota bacterium]